MHRRNAPIRKRGRRTDPPMKKTFALRPGRLRRLLLLPLQLIEQAAAGRGLSARSGSLARTDGRLRAYGVKHRCRGAAGVGQNCQAHADNEKQRAQNRGGAGQGVGLTASAHKPAASAAANAKRAPFGTLQQHDRDKRENDHQVDDDKNGFHDAGGYTKGARKAKPNQR